MPDSRKPALSLHVRDLEDLSVVSSMVQDAILPVGDFTFLRDEGCFILALNRFQWETAEGDGPYYRIHSGLRFDHVHSVQFKKIDRQDKKQILSLLAVAWAEGEDGEPDQVVLQFAGGPAVKLKVGKLHCTLQDLGEPWPTQWKPGHETAK
ncbi:MAG: DUF2948 family protein [Alphaproteobacteria bacterium]